jgi:signal transduction histidine kinase
MFSFFDCYLSACLFFEREKQTCTKTIKTSLSSVVICIGIAALFITNRATAEQFQLSPSMPVTAPIHFSTILEDKDGTLDPADIIQGRLDSQFHARTGGRSSMGISSSAWWIKFDANNATPHTIDWILNVPFPLTDILDAYHVSDQGPPTKVLVGDTRPFSDRPIPGEGFAIPLQTRPSSHSTVYLRLKFISSGAIDTYFEVSSPDVYIENQRIYGIILGFLIGGCVLMFGYNAVILCVIRSKIYLWYLTYLASVMATLVTTTGLGNRYLWSHTSVLGDAMPLIASSCLFLFAVQFSRSLLDLRRIAPLADKALLGFIAIFVVAMVVYFAGFREAAVKLTLLFGLGLSVLPIIGLSIWKRGGRIAKTFTLAWGIWAITVTTMVARYMGLVASNSFTLRAAWIGILCETLLFALALADRIRNLQKEKEEADRGRRAALERSNEELENLVKIRTSELTNLNKQKDKFFSIIAHDLTGPFNALMGLSSLLVSGGEKMARGKIIEYSQDLNTSANNLYKLVENLLSWALLQKGNLTYSPEIVNIEDQFRAAYDVFNSAASQKNITIHCRNTEPIFVRADKHMLDTIVRNLLNNAVKFTHSGGEIICSAKHDGAWVTVSIVDNGIGISPENIDHLFDLGDATINSGTAGENGTGLGLQLCKELIDLHGGELKVESEKSRGSTFSFTIPSAP